MLSSGYMINGSAPDRVSKNTTGPVVHFCSLKLYQSVSQLHLNDVGFFWGGVWIDLPFITVISDNYITAESL